MSIESSSISTEAASDLDLLGQFLRSGDESSFTEIVRRYGPLVHGVCRRLLGDSHEVDDAFQATFLVLAKSGAKIKKRQSLASWLYGVAYRIALKSAKKRKSLEPIVDPMSDDEGPLEAIARRNTEKVVGEELNELPESYRGPMLLCYFEGQSNQQIAQLLELSVAAVEGRLKRGRAELRRRLLRRGVAFGGFVAVATLSRQAVAAASGPLIEATVEASLSFASGTLSASVLSHQLAQAEIAEMAFITHKLVSLVAACILATGIVAYSFSGLVVGQERDGGKQEVSVNTGGGDSQAASQPATIVARTAQATANPTVTMGRNRQAVEKIGSKLDGNLEVDFTAEQLPAVAAFFSSKLKIPIVIDSKSLEEIGLTADQIKISLQLKEVSARSALHLILDAQDLDYVIDNEVLLITTPEYAETKQDTRVYLSEDLAIEPDTLVETITNSLAADTWQEVGGPGTISVVDEPSQRLVIAQTARVHEQIKDLLDQLRRTSPVDAKRKRSGQKYTPRKTSGGGFFGGTVKPAAKPAAATTKPAGPDKKPKNLAH